MKIERNIRMLDLNDFHAYKSTSGGDGSGCGFGCSMPMIFIGIIVVFLYLLGKCSS